MKLTLTDKKPSGADTYSFYFKPEQPLTWKAGQYLRYHIEDTHADNRSENRFFSIASAPGEGQIMLTTKFVPGDGSTFKKNLQTLQIGDSIAATGPGGVFTVDDLNQQYVFIAGGIGITPFRSILLDLHQRHLPINVLLLYANRTDDVIFKEELEEIKASHPEFVINFFLGDNRIDESAIRKNVPDLNKPNFYISGPEPMVQNFEKILAQMGVSSERIKRDYFPGYTII